MIRTQVMPKLMSDNDGSSYVRIGKLRNPGSETRPATNRTKVGHPGCTTVKVPAGYEVKQRPAILLKRQATLGYLGSNIIQKIIGAG
jgi:hypothetical protein